MYAQQCAQSTNTNRSIGLIRSRRSKAAHQNRHACKNLERQNSPHSQRGRVRSAGPVATARGKHPIPSRTRKLRPVAPMVLRLKPWESRSPPDPQIALKIPLLSLSRYQYLNAGWSSPVARQAHNLKVVGSNPTPATIFVERPRSTARAVCVWPAANPKSSARSPSSIAVEPVSPAFGVTTIRWTRPRSASDASARHVGSSSASCSLDTFSA